MKIRIHGRVQGVGFRYAARDEARKHEIRGFARNDPNGTVFIEAQGDEKDLKVFLAWCRKGPWAAKVEKVEEELIDEMGNFTDFLIQ